MMNRKLGGLLLIIAVAMIFRGTELAAAGLTNNASILLFASWQQATSRVGFLTCQSYGQFSAIESSLRLALRLDPHRLGTVSNLGRALWLEGRCDAAREMWRMALDDGDQVTTVNLLRADKGGAFDQELSLQLSQYAYATALILQTENREDETAAWYKVSNQLYPSFKASERLAGYYFRQGKSEAAISVWQALAASLPDDNPQKWWAIGQVAEVGSQWQSAANAYGKAADLSLKPYDYLMRQGYAYEQDQDFARAEQAYEVARSGLPDRLDSYLALGNLAIRQKAYDRAISWFLAAKGLAPERNEASAGLGYAYYLKDDCVQALGDLELAVQMKSDDFWTTYLLSQCLFKVGNKSRAIVVLNQAITGHPGQPWPWVLTLGDWRFEAGDRDGALEAYRLAEQWGGDKAEIENRIQKILKQ